MSHAESADLALRSRRHERRLMPNCAFHDAAWGRASAQQMSYYYGQPLVHCYLLHAEWLTLMSAKLGEKPDVECWRDVVKATIQASESAQNHLLIMHEYNSNPKGNRRSRMEGASISHDTPR
jgi:hypothetical protein